MNAAQAYLACYVVFERDGKILFVKRENTGFMDGFYGLPAGRVDLGEAILLGAAREAQEEVGLVVNPDNLTHIHTMYRNTGGGANPYWIDVFFRADSWEGEPVNNEPDRHSEIAWLDANHLPGNIQDYVAYALENIAAGKTYSELIKN